MTETEKDAGKVAGGVARANALTPTARSAIARKAALARHRKDIPKAIAEGVLKIGGITMPCAVLDDSDNTRVLTQNGFLKAIGRHPYAPGGEGSAIDHTAPFLRAKNLKDFISSDLERSSTPLLYLPRNPTSGAGGVGYGYRARLLPDVCWVYQDAMSAGRLLPGQQHIGVACRAFLKALTNYAIEDLVDQATGFDDLRKREAINRIIEKYCAPKSLPWIRMFDIDFYRQIYRLNGWPFDPDKTARPSVIGHWTNDIYDRLAPMIRPELHNRVKRNAKGKPIQKLTTYLTPEEGKPRLRELLEGVKALMRISIDWDDYKTKLDIAYPRFDNSLILPFAGGLPRLPKPSPSDSEQLS
jgi:P63C domain-containing protein